MPFMKSIDIIRKPIYCKSCMKEIRISPIRHLIEKEPLLCDECISQIKMKLVFRTVFSTRIFFISEYDGLFKTWLMNYKEYGDIELAPCFLSVFRPILKCVFPDVIYVPLPSSIERIQKRGFSHLDEILSSSHLPYLNPFISYDVEEQKNNKGTRRIKKKKIELTKEAFSLKNKKIVLFDDVMTSGSTYQQCLELIQEVQPKKVRGLILMDNLHHGRIGS